MGPILSGTWDEIKQREAEFSGHRLLVIIDPEGDASMQDTPPFTVTSQDQLLELLRAGIDSGPGIEATADFWDQKEAELISRHERRSAS